MPPRKTMTTRRMSPGARAKAICGRTDARPEAETNFKSSRREIIRLSPIEFRTGKNESEPLFAIAGDRYDVAGPLRCDRPQDAFEKGCGFFVNDARNELSNPVQPLCEARWREPVLRIFR